MRRANHIKHPKQVDNEADAIGVVTGQDSASEPAVAPEAATLRDVARAAGVSTATVSRAFNRPDTVRERLRQRIEDAATALRYIPNEAARTLVSRRSRVIGAIVSTMDDTIVAQGIMAIQTRVEAAGFGLMVAACNGDSERELAQARTMVGRGIEALILVGVRHHRDLRTLLRGYRIPYVCHGVFAPATEPACVGIDYRHAAYIASCYLLELGHRRIDLVARFGFDDERAQDRIAGTRDAMENAGVVNDPLRVDHVMMDSACGIDTARLPIRRLLDSAAPPTAVVCESDIVALGVLRECQARGVAVPGELSIIGFGDLPPARYANPALTTIRVPASIMGTAAADFVLTAMAGGAPTAVELPGKLVIRASTGPVLPV